MEEKTITLAAEAAIDNLELDCRIEDVRNLSGDKWCVEFSGEYGPLRDDFKNQFGKENSSKVIREKIKRHLLEQVTKIRSNTGKTKRPKDTMSDKRGQSRASEATYKLIDDAFGRASQLAGRVVERVSGAATAARDAVSSIAENLTPVSIEINTITSAKKKRPARAAKQKAAPARKSGAKTARKASRTGKKVSKAGGSKAKSSGKGRPAGAKKSKAVARRR